MKKIAAFGGSLVALATSFGSALAQGMNIPAQTTIAVNLDDAGFQIRDFGKLVTGLLNMVMFIAAMLVFAYLIWGGVQWITSGGDKGKTEEARNKITAAIIGLAVVAASYAIFLLAASFLGVGNPFSGAFEVPKAYEDNAGARGTGPTNRF